MTKTLILLLLLNSCSRPSVDSDYDSFDDIFHEGAIAKSKFESCSVRLKSDNSDSIIIEFHFDSIRRFNYNAIKTDSQYQGLSAQLLFVFSTTFGDRWNVKYFENPD